MDNSTYYTASVTRFSDLLGRPLRTPGCVILYCTRGCATAECNFTKTSFRRGSLTVIFSDTLFAIQRISRGFEARYFELSAPLTDETTFTSTDPFLDWLYEHPVFRIPDERKRDMELWLSMTDWIETNATRKNRDIMLRNQWQNFFLGLESALKNRLAENDIKTISSARRLFNDFCKLLSENCRKRHDVGFYADRLCVTPYYLSRVTNRIFDVSPKELIDRQIMMEIKSLLTSTELSVKEIAHMFGFESSSYLGRYFRRHIGLTPSEYRESHC